MPVAFLLWALSLRTKPQVLPFFVVALSCPLAVALWLRCWRTARLLASGLAGTLATLGVLAWGEKLLFSSRLFSATSASDPYKVLGDASNLRTYVFTLVPSVRLLAVSMAVLFAMPLVLGVCYNGLKFAKCLHDRDMHSGQKVCRLSLWCMVCAWLGWYLLLSIGWTRYLFPAMFLGSIFVAVLLKDLVGGFNLPRLVVQGAKVLRQRHFTLRGTGILLTAIVIPMLFLATLGMLYKSFVLLPDDSVVQAAQFLNTHTKTDALVETYDSEIFFLLERSYHYPPDSVQHQLNRRAFFGQDNVIDYDPMAHDLDYLVVGTMSRWWGLCQPVLDSGAFRLLQTYGAYEIYGRVDLARITGAELALAGPTWGTSGQHRGGRLVRGGLTVTAASECAALAHGAERRISFSRHRHLHPSLLRCRNRQYGFDGNKPQRECERQAGADLC